MTADSYKDLIKVAIESVEEFDEPYKSIAFREILRSLLQRGEAVPVQTKSSPTVVLDGDKTLQETYEELKPKGHPNIVLSFAYYYYSTGNPEFNVIDIEESYGKLLIPKSKNPADIINNNRKKGFIMPLDELKDSKKAFAITRKGLEEVEKGFTD